MVKKYQSRVVVGENLTAEHFFAYRLLAKKSKFSGILGSAKIQHINKRSLFVDEGYRMTVKGRIFIIVEEVNIVTRGVHRYFFRTLVKY